jgi:hypothetical protein
MGGKRMKKKKHIQLTQAIHKSSPYARVQVLLVTSEAVTLWSELISFTCVERHISVLEISIDCHHAT